MKFTIDDVMWLKDEETRRCQRFDPAPGWKDIRELMPWLDQPRPCKITLSDHVILEDKAEEV